MAPVTQAELLSSVPQLLSRERLSSSPSSPSPPSEELLARDGIADMSPRDGSLLDPAPPLLAAREASDADWDLQPHRLLSARQSSQTQPIIVPGTYIGIDPGANGGEVAGIVLGVVFGIVLVLLIISSVLANPFRPVVGTSRMTEGGGARYHGEVSDRRARTRSSRKTARSRSSNREEVTEVRRERERSGPAKSPRRARERIIVEESRRESRPPPPSDYSEDLVEVFEEDESNVSPARQPRRSSGYRNVDPMAYGGGGRSVRKVRR